MASKSAIECLMHEFNKFNFMDGSLDGMIDLKVVESNLRILTFESDVSLIGKEDLIEIIPGILLALSSSDKNLRLTVGKFLLSLKDFIKSVDYKQNDWNNVISIEFLKICTDRLRFIVEEYSDDWIEPWLLLVNIAFTNSDGELCSSKLNFLLSVIEKAFKTAKVKKDSVKTTFQVWERFNTILSESQCFPKVVNTAKILHLLVLPFVGIKLQTADPYKHKAWFHVIEKIGLHSVTAIQKIVQPFLQFLIDNKRIFIKFPLDIGDYLKKMSTNIYVATNYCSDILKCLEMCIDHGSKHDDIISSWTSLCSHMTNSGMDYEYFKNLLNFLKNRPDDPEQRELLVKLCLIANQHKFFDFKSVYFEDIRSTIEEVFPLIMCSLMFREKVFNKLLSEMMEITECLMQKANEEEEGCMDPIMSMWETMVYVYSDFVDASLDSGFEPTQTDINIISDLLILALTQTLFESPQNEEKMLCKKLKTFIQYLVKKIKTELFSNEFLTKFETEIKSSHISLENCLWLSSFTSKLETDVNLIPLLSILIKSIAGCSQPKLVLEFLHILDMTTEKIGLKITFKPSLNYLRKFSSTYEPPFDSQIRQVAHNLLKRVNESGENKATVTPNSEVEDKKHNTRSPLTVHSNFLSRLSKAEEKKNHKINLAASMFPRGETEKNELNKENKSIERKELVKAKSIKPSDIVDIHLSPVADRFAKSAAFILDNSESSESLLIDDSVEPKVSSFKVSTDFHKTGTPTKLNVQNRMVAGLSPKYDVKSTENNLGEASPKSLCSPNSNKIENLSAKQIPSTPRSSVKINAKNRYCFLDSSMDTEEFVFVPPKSKNKESPLTTRQKEVMKKRREEIPALYQDLSQDTQNTNESSSQETSTFSVSLNPKRDVPINNCDKSIQKTDGNDKNSVDTITNVLDEENAVSNGFSAELLKQSEQSYVDEVENINKNQDQEEKFPKRLNFEGICLEESPNYKISEIPKRQYSRKSLHNSDEKNAISTGKKRKISDNVKITSEENNLIKSQELSFAANVSQDKSMKSEAKRKRGRPTRFKPVINKNVEVKHDSELTAKSNISPKRTRKSRASNILDKSTTESEVLRIKVDSKEYDIYVEYEPSSKQVNKKSMETKNVQNTTPEIITTPNKEELIESNEVNSDVKSPSSNIINPLTPPSTEITNRRKRSKRSIQFNEFSPKMLRKSRTNAKINSTEKKLKGPVKSIKLLNDDQNLEGDGNKQGDSKVKAQGSDSDHTNCVIPSNKIIPQISNEIIEYKEKNLTSSDDSANYNSVKNVKLNSPTKAVSNKEASSVISKSSPNRAAKIMQLANLKNKIKIQSKFSSLINVSSVNAEEKVKVVKEKYVNSHKNAGSAKSNTSPSRAAIILKLAENDKTTEKIKTIDNELDANKLHDVSIFSKEKDNKITDATSCNSTEDSFKNLKLETVMPTNGKRKSITKSPSGKKMKLDSPLSLDITQPSKSKRSNLDGWIIKKEKSSQNNMQGIEINGSSENNISQINDNKRDATVPDNEIDDLSECKSSTISNDTIVEDRNQCEGETLITSQLETNLKQSQSESPKLLVESEISEVENSLPESRPKRIRRDNKPVDFVYLNTGRRPRNRDNNVTPTKRKQKPQLDLSPSRSYSYLNWPKGDCEAWIACEPTPPEASPASAILKRKSAYNSPQTSPCSTPKKRVSFIDPVVTKGLLYNKEECGGKIQHALSDLGKSTIIIKKTPEFNSTKDDKTSDPIDTLSTSIDENSKSIDTSNESSSEVVNEEKDKMLADNRLSIHKIVDKKELNEANNEVNKSNLESSVYNNCETDSCGVNGSNLDQLDIVERVVGKAPKEAAACIVELVECSTRDLSSDESESEYLFRMSISDDINIIPLDKPTDITEDKEDTLIVNGDECEINEYITSDNKSESKEVIQCSSEINKTSISNSDQDSAQLPMSGTIQDSAQSPLPNNVQDSFHSHTSDYVQDSAQSSTSDAIHDSAPPISDDVQDSTESPISDARHESAPLTCDDIQDSAQSPTSDAIHDSVSPTSDVVQESAQSIYDTVQDSALPLSDGIQDSAQSPISDVVQDFVQSPISDAAQDSIWVPNPDAGRDQDSRSVLVIEACNFDEIQTKQIKKIHSHEVTTQIHCGTDENTNLHCTNELKCDLASTVVEQVMKNEKLVHDDPVRTEETLNNTSEPKHLVLPQENNLEDKTDKKHIDNASENIEETINISGGDTTEVESTEGAVIKECDRFGYYLNTIDIKNLSSRAFQKLASTLISGLQKLYLFNPQQTS